MKRLISLLFALVSVTCIAQEKENTLVVYGDGFKYSVEIPEGWQADTAASNELYVNLAIYETGVEVDQVNGRIIIQVYTFKKENSNLKEDLNLDINNLMEEHRDLELNEFMINAGGFKCNSKLAFVKNKLYQYLVYMDPGKKYKSAVSVTMNTGFRKATDSEMKAIRRIVGSVKMING